MVKQEIIFWRYVWKTQFVSLILPLLFMLLAAIFMKSNGDLTKQILNFVVFPIMPFPIIALLYQIGSIHHKELLLTYPLNNFIFGWIRPVIISLIYSLLFIGLLKTTNNYTSEEILAAYTASFFYMILVVFFLIWSKNIALGISLPLAYLFFGMLTTGSGQGFLYLFQWSRPNPNLSIVDCAVTQGIAAVGFSLWALYFLVKRNKYHWSL